MTLEAVKPINMLSIDADTLTDVEEIPEAVRFAVVLDSEPSLTWAQEFSTAYSLLHHPIKPPCEVNGDRIWIAYLPRYANDLQAYVDFLKLVVERANVEEKRTLQMHEHDNAREKSKLREILRSLRL